MKLPSFEPMRLSLKPTAFDHPEFIFELKHDGFRSLAYISDSQCKLVSRRYNVYKSFETLRETMARLLRVENAVLDGEIVAWTLMVTAGSKNFSTGSSERLSLVGELLLFGEEFFACSQPFLLGDDLGKIHYGMVFRN